MKEVSQNQKGEGYLIFIKKYFTQQLVSKTCTYYFYFAGFARLPLTMNINIG